MKTDMDCLIISLYRYQFYFCCIHIYLTFTQISLLYIRAHFIYIFICRYVKSMNCVATDFLSMIPLDSLYICMYVILIFTYARIHSLMYVSIYYFMSYKYLNSFVRKFRYKKLELPALLNKTN